MFIPSIQPGASVDKEVLDFVKASRKMLIANAWCDSISGQTFETFNPATGEVLCRVALGTKEDIDLAVRAARRAFDQSAWRRTTPADRSRMLWKLADLVEANLESLAQLESLNQGMSLLTAKIGNVSPAVKALRYMAGLARTQHGMTPQPSPTRADLKLFPYTVREPIGVVGQIIPWNFPLLMAAWKIGPALAAGCTVVLKPAEQTPLTALRLGELALEAGFPEGVLNIVPGTGENAGAALAAHRLVDKIAFTGSTETGRKIVRASAETNLKKITLELGGKSANLVLQDADLNQAISGIVSSITLNQGQVCFAGSRLYIHKSIANEFMQGLQTEFAKLKLGHGFETDVNICPLVSRDQVHRVESYLRIGKQEGALLQFGGNTVQGKGFFVAPAIFSVGENGLRIVQEEIFGPVLSVMQYESVDDAVSLANDTNYGLAAGVWTRDISLAHQTVSALKAGTIWVNGYNILDPTLPFGGYRQSGWGRELGLHALDAYAEEKSVIVKL